MAPFDAALNKLGLHLVQHRLDLLAHGLAKHVCLALAESSKLLRQQHDLFLVDRDAVGFAQVFLHVGEVVRNRFHPVLAANEARYVFKRTRTVQRVHGNQVAKDRGLEVLEVLLHARRFVLEDADRVSALKKLVRSRVVERNVFDVYFDAVALADQLQAVLDERKRLEPQEVHLQQPCRLNHGVVELRGPHRAVFGCSNRNQLANVAGRDDHATGVNARVAQRAFEHFSLLQRGRFEVGAFRHFAKGDRLVVVLVAEFFANRGIVGIQKNRKARVVGHRLRESVGLVKRQVQSATRVLNRRLGRHGSVGNDLSNLVGAVLVDDVLNDLVAAPVVKVNIDIGQAHAVRIQEALEQQVVGNGIDVRDACGVGNGRTCRRPAARPDAYAHIAGGLAKVLNDQEVARVAGALNGFQLKINPFNDFSRYWIAPALRGPYVGQVP